MFTLCSIKIYHELRLISMAYFPTKDKEITFRVFTSPSPHFCHQFSVFCPLLRRSVRLNIHCSICCRFPQVLSFLQKSVNSFRVAETNFYRSVRLVRLLPNPYCLKTRFLLYIIEQVGSPLSCCQEPLIFPLSVRTQ